MNYKKFLCVLCYLLIVVFIANLGAVPFTTMGFMKVPDAYVIPANMAETVFSCYTYNENTEKTTPNPLINGFLQKHFH